MKSQWLKNSFKIGVSILISLLALYLSTRNVQWDRLRSILGTAKPIPILLALSLSVITLTVRAIRWRVLLNPFQKISPLVLFRWQVGGLVINNLFPLRVGEFARAYWAGHKSSIPKSTIFATIVVERIADVSSIAAVVGCLLLWVGMGGTHTVFRGSHIAFAIAAIGFLIVLMNVILSRSYHRSFLERLKKLIPVHVRPVFENFLSGLKIFTDKNEIIKVLMLSFLIWTVDITVITIFSRSLGLNLTWTQGGLTIGGLILGVMVPAAPGAAGTYEAGGVGALTLMGFDKTLALSFIFLLHASQYIFFLTLGIPTLIAEGFSFKQISTEEKSVKDDVP